MFAVFAMVSAVSAVSAMSAFFANKRHTFLIARIYESLMEDAVTITVRAFHERELAAHWLGVPLAILCPPADEPRE
jgi:hypothetical protein